MSKKLAEGPDAMVLDIKFGSGAFLPDIEDGKKLVRDTPTRDSFEDALDGTKIIERLFLH